TRCITRHPKRFIQFCRCKSRRAKNGSRTTLHTLLRRRRRTVRAHARLSARPRWGRRRRARETRRFPARFPRRHHSSLDAGRDGGAWPGGQQYAFADFGYLPTRCKFIAVMPQWDFLNFLADRGKRYPSFHLRMRAEAVDLIEDGGRVTGVRANTPD